MKFSELYNVEHEDSTEWFDPILGCDTRLFLDPFLVFKTEHEHFRRGHAKIIGFFEVAFKLCAEAKSQEDLRYKKLKRMLLFPEVRELCIGYAESTDMGLGTGRRFADRIAAAIDESIAAGIKSIEHFEETGLLQVGIGRDRISDATAGILMEELISYTQEICRSLRIPMRPFEMRIFDYKYLRWVGSYFNLPENPVTGKAVLLVPVAFLRDLPTINYADFRDWLWEDAALREDFNYEVKSELKKRDIVEFALKHRSCVTAYIDEVEKRTPTSYNIKRDPKGVYAWYDAAQLFIAQNSLQLKAPRDVKGFAAILDLVVSRFANYAENTGCDLLWNPGKPKPESAAQKLFYGVALGYCESNNIVVSRETDLGCGSVDFHFSNGYSQRAILEVKLASNGKFWNGLEKQLPKYQRVADVHLGYFIAVAFTDKELKKVEKLSLRAAAVGRRNKTDIRVIIVDARRGKPTASRL